MKRLLALFLFSFLSSGACAAPKSGTEVLRYDDFGPQAMSYELVGMGWWQWQPHGDSRPREYDIKVVVYRGTSLAQVKRRYPVNPSKDQDYRYVKYNDAIRYLDTQIAENLIDTTTERLKLTKQRLLDRFASSASTEPKPKVHSTKPALK
jgi:hypothetical protein